MICSTQGSCKCRSYGYTFAGCISKRVAEKIRVPKSTTVIRLVESYRNETGRICHRTILNVGFLDDELTPEQLNLIARTLSDMYQCKQSIFPQNDPLISKWVAELWGKIVGVKGAWILPLITLIIEW